MSKLYNPEELIVTIEHEGEEKITVPPSKEDIYSTNGWVGNLPEEKGEEE